MVHLGLLWHLLTPLLSQLLAARLAQQMAVVWWFETMEQARAQFYRLE